MMAERPHLFPSRTQQLSSHASKVLGWKRPGRIDCCRSKKKPPHIACGGFYFCGKTELTMCKKHFTDVYGFCIILMFQNHITDSSKPSCLKIKLRAQQANICKVDLCAGYSHIRIPTVCNVHMILFCLLYNDYYAYSFRRFFIMKEVLQ